MKTNLLIGFLFGMTLIATLLTLELSHARNIINDQQEYIDLGCRGPYKGAE